MSFLFFIVNTIGRFLPYLFIRFFTHEHNNAQRYEKYFKKPHKCGKKCCFDRKNNMPKNILGKKSL